MSEPASPAAMLLLVVAAALVGRDGRVLVQRRPPGSDHAGLWEFPGGKLEVGEVPEQALVRELREELGIDVDPSALVPAGFASQPASGRHLLLLLFTCRKWVGEPRALHATELRWLEPDRFADLPTPPADLPLMQRLSAGLWSPLDQSVGE